MAARRRRVEYHCAVCGNWFWSKKASAVCSSACRHLSWGMDNIKIEKRRVKQTLKPKASVHASHSKYGVQAERRIVEIPTYETQYRCVMCAKWFTAAKSAVYCCDDHRKRSSELMKAGGWPPYAANKKSPRPPEAEGTGAGSRDP